MYNGQTVFSQIMAFIPIKKFRRCVDRYNGNYRVRSFTCFDQFLCMAFAQLTYRESLRDIECCLRAIRGKLYHMGIKGKVSRSTIAYANENRDWRIYCDFAQIRATSGTYVNYSVSKFVSVLFDQFPATYHSDAHCRR